MEERTCPHCGLTYSANEENKCPHCGAVVTAEPEATEPVAETPPATVPGEPLPAVTEVQPPVVAPAVPAIAPPAPPPMPTPTAALADGQIRCPHCGEALYAGEQVCWNCGKRVDDPVAASAEATTPAATAPPAVPATPAAAPLPPAMAPVTAAPQPPPQLGWDELPRAEDKPAPSAEAMRLSYWSLGLGLAALLTCGALSILGPIALWLGAKARREGGDTVATVGFVLGIIGTVVFVIVAIAVVLMIIGVMVGSSQSLAPPNWWFA